MTEISIDRKGNPIPIAYPLLLKDRGLSRVELSVLIPAREAWSFSTSLFSCMSETIPSDISTEEIRYGGAGYSYGISGIFINRLLER